MASIKIRGRYCISCPGILKWIQMIFAAIVLCLILWETVQDQYNMGFTRFWDANNYQNRHAYLIDGEQFTCIVAVICIISSIVFLIIFFLNCHDGPCGGCACFIIAFVYYGIMVLLWLISAAVEIYATLEWKKQKYDWTIRTLIRPKWDDIDGFYRRRAAATAFCFANALLYIVSFQQAKYKDL